MNTTLKSKQEIAQYIEHCRVSGFVHRADAPKNWDNFKAVQHVLQTHTNLDAQILDAGGIQASAFLPTLERFGYTRLVALDLSNPNPPRLVGNIAYKRGNITQTAYPRGWFDAVACLSVIEHGVDVERFFGEMARIIKPGGTLIMSTDYWAEKIRNPDGRQAYGVPVFIFSREEIEHAIECAGTAGFDLTSQPDLDCQDKTIDWMGFQYTFIVLGFVRRLPAC